MTDFSTVLRRAISNLPDNTVAARRELYARAETALVSQLQKSDPPADPDHIASMRDSLRQAAREIEAEHAGTGASGGAPSASTTPAAPAKPAAPAATAATDKPAPPRPVIPGSPGYVSPLRQRPAAPAAQPSQPAAAAAPAAQPQAPVAAAAPASASPAPSAPLATPAATPAAGPHPQAGAAPAATVGLQQIADQPGEAAPLVATGPAGDGSGGPVEPNFEDWPDPAAYELESRGKPWGWLIALVVIACLAGVGFWKRDAIMQAAQPLLGLLQPGGADEPKVDVRLSDDNAQDGTGQTADADSPGEPDFTTVPADAVIEALLVEESSDGQAAPIEVPGSVTWTLNREDGLAVIEGRVQIPSRDLSLSLMIRKNTDPAFPATHTIDFVFSLPPDFGGGGINNVPGLLTKTTPKARGGPLAGEVVRVDEGIFLMALLAGDLDAPRNMQALTEHPFLDVPVIYANGQRAIVTMAKGPEGEKVFADAFAEWGQAPQQ